MSTYLLLRSNKQTGPFTLDEVRAMGLKAYDLIWVEGKSAAWRYPGEIEELKAYAPLVEEQPFDRFFKKPVHEEQSPIANKQTAFESENRRAASLNQSQAAPNAGNRTVYINLPSEKKEEKSTQPQTDKVQFIFEKSEPKQTLSKEPVQKSFSQSIQPAIAEPVQLEEKYSRSFDDIKKEYQEKVLRQRRRRPINIRNVVKPAVVGFGLVSLLAGGIFIGLSINKRGTNSTQKDLAKEQVGVSDQQSIFRTKTIPVSSSLPSQQADKNTNNKINEDISGDNGTALNDKETAPVEKKKTKSSRQKLSDSALAENKNTPKTDSASIVKHAETSRQTEVNAQKDNIKNNIEDYVSLSASNYNVGTFGGISDLQVTVSNTSPFPLDLVVVEVQYVQSNKKIFKTENLYFHNINAGAAIMQEAPKSPRGVKVKYRITMINSKGLGISFTDI